MVVLVKEDGRGGRQRTDAQDAYESRDGRVSAASHPSPLAMADTRQFGDLAIQLVTESRRSTLTDTLLKYNDPLIRQIIREQRDLEKLIQGLLRTDNVSPSLLVYQTAIIRNKRCLLAYEMHGMDRLRDMYWACGCALPHILSNASLRSKLSPHEVDYLRQYNTSTMSFRASFASDISPHALANQSEIDVDITANIEKPPKDLHVLVWVKRDCGTIQTEVGSIDFRKGQRFLVRRADVEHLIVQGYLEEV